VQPANLQTTNFNHRIATQRSKRPFRFRARPLCPIAVVLPTGPGCQRHRPQSDIRFPVIRKSFSLATYAGG
jgi:hypothetical protein